MKKTAKLLVILMSVISSGCYKTVKEKQVVFHLSPQEKIALAEECSEINSNGNILKLLAEIKSETKEALMILENEDLLKREERIRLLADSVDKKTKLVLNLSKPEWSTVRWAYEVKWQIDREDFNDLLGIHFKKGFSVTDVQIQDVYFMGQKKSELIAEIELARKNNRAIIIYKNTGSSLELCQLNKTMMIMMKVDYRNIKNNNVRFFNLTSEY